MTQYLDGRKVTFTYLGTMSDDEALDILAEYIAKRIYKKRKTGEIKEK